MPSDLPTLLALAAALGWASGLRLYLVVFITGTLAGLAGGTLAATSFAAKASTRAAVNTSPEPFSNIAVSFAEEGLVLSMMWLATNYPLTFGVALAVVVALMIWLIIHFLGFLRNLTAKVKSFL